MNESDDTSNTPTAPPLKRRDFVGRLGATVAAASLSSGLLHGKERKKKGAARPPNVVFILTDQQRYDTLGCNGNAQAITPRIDALAEEGVRFESSYVAQPVCAPCRSSIITGQFPHTTGVIDNNITLIDHSTAFPRLLHEAGYKTGYIGKWHLGPRGDDTESDGRKVSPSPAYFDVWKGYDTGASLWLGGKEKGGGYEAPTNSLTAIPDGPKPGTETYRADWNTDQVTDFIRENQSEPFMVMVGYYPPHTPWTAPLENCLRMKGKIEYPTYHAMVNRIDENVGRIVDTVDELGLRENTIFVFTSEHGHTYEEYWSHPYKRLCYDVAAKVPLIISWRGHLQKGVRAQPISHTDLAPTIIDLCGLPVPEGMEGMSAKALLNGDGKDWHESIVIENQPYVFPESAMYERCVITDDWKLILNSGRPPELYHRKKDPDEANNLYHDTSLEAVKGELFDKLEAWAWRTQDNLTLSKHLLEKWKA